MPTLSVTKLFEFEAAHLLPKHEGKCRFLHGHSFKLEVTIAGHVDDRGMIMDYSNLKSIVTTSVVDLLDHKNLNERFEDPTSENIILWIVSKLNKAFSACSVSLSRVRLWETSTSYVEYER
jgi:6-pyruvoyltetrahydropterin/6-carboxytetrahydropterin synthase